MWDFKNNIVDLEEQQCQDDFSFAVDQERATKKQRVCKNAVYAGQLLGLNPNTANGR